MLSTGNYCDSLRDAKAAIQLQPSYLKAIVRGRYRVIFLKRNISILVNDLLTAVSNLAPIVIARVIKFINPRWKSSPM